MNNTLAITGAGEVESGFSIELQQDMVGMDGHLLNAALDELAIRETFARFANRFGGSMPKRIILLSDGTGNSAAKVWRTNVWRVFESLDLADPQQVAFYDDGVGTSSFKPIALLGGAFGYGLKRNVLDIYKFACRNYQDRSDEIFGFGFSRGAFTIRVVVGLILNQGLVAADSEEELDVKARAAYRAYRKERFHTYLRIERFFRWFRDLFVAPYSSAENREIEHIRLLGLWDTVAAYGLPVDEMTRGVNDWIWPLELPDHELSPKVQRACHALSLDDERTTFHPVLWDESKEAGAPPDERGKRFSYNERLSQVWFAGVHANVGGGYPDDSIAHIPLLWVMSEAALCGLRFKAAPDADPDAFRHIRSIADKDGRIYDSRSGLGGYYRYGPRNLGELCNNPAGRRGGGDVFIPRPKIHESVFKRITANSHFYAPTGIPADYEVLNSAGEILSVGAGTPESAQAAQERAVSQEWVWNWIAIRQIVYLATVATTAYLLLYPLVRSLPRWDEYTSRFRWLSDMIRVVGNLLPGLATPWINQYARNPFKFAAVALLIAGLVYLSSRLASRNSDRMRALWNNSMSGQLTRGIRAAPAASRGRRLLLQVRDFWRRYAGPFLSAVGILWLGTTLGSHVLFNIQDTAGLVCRASEPGDGLAPNETKSAVFEASSLCFDTGINVDRGGTYQLALTPNEQWSDGGLLTSIAGYYTMDAPTWGAVVKRFLLLPLRRELIRPWFRVVARYGETGGEEVFLDPDERTGKLDVRLVPRVDGRLFLFVNDGVIGLPGLYGMFYRNNVGSAAVTLHRITH